MPIRIKKGLDIPLAGEPQTIVADGNAVSSVALLGIDTPGLKPRMAVSEGDRVQLGQALFVDKRSPDIQFTSPGAGVVSAINRGAKRVLQSVVVELDGSDEVRFAANDPERLDQVDIGTLRDTLVRSGLWTSLRTRPFSRIPDPDGTPHSVFVTAIDTNPHAPDPAPIIAENSEAFAAGVRIVARLTTGKTYVCTKTGSNIAVPETDTCRREEFSGPHPAGLVGTHMHFLDPVGEQKTSWHLGYQDVIAIGELFLSGRLRTERIVSLSGPMVRSPRLLRTRNGANIRELVDGELSKGDVRAISGSVLSGHRAIGGAAWLGRYHRQLTVLAEGSEREFLEWMRPGVGKYSALRAYVGNLFSGKAFQLTTSQNGSPRAMVPIGSFERVMPLDILPTVLLKALLVRDTDAAKDLGCLELDEEDLALCSFVCNGKYEYGPHLRQTLDEIEANG